MAAEVDSATELGAVRSALFDVDETDEVIGARHAPPAATEIDEIHPKRISEASDRDTTKGLSGRKWSSRLGLKRKDSLEADAGKVNGVEITHAAYGSRKLPLSLTLTLAYQTIGVVYGDIGTSPLYVYSSVFPDRIPTNDEVLGVLSIIIYTVTLIPLLKYVFIVLRANDHGNGGTFALYTKICRHAKLSVALNQVAEDQELSTYNLDTSTSTFQRSTRVKEKLQRSKVLKTALLCIAVLGTCMVIGDGVLTPSISVLSAIQGIKTAVPAVQKPVVVTISCVILVGLFSIQRYGPDKVGYLFSPVVIIWFLSIGLIGVFNIVKYDSSVFKAFNPYYIYDYFKTDKKQAWVSLGGAVLCITGTEAMFADLGHFSVRSIQLAFTTLVYPSLLCAYVGQAAYLMKHPEHVSETFYKSIPSPIYWPMFAVATGAAIIASQAMISATFSIIYQAMTLGCFPKVKIVHTSKKYPGQIYIPEMNWLLMVLCIAIAAGFGDTKQIGNAYGVAVNADMLITTNLLTIVIIMIWQWPLYAAICFEGLLCSVELAYFSSVLNKIPQGGWVPLVFVGIFSFIMFTWYYGRAKKYQYEVQNKVSLDWVLGLGSNLGIARVPGIGLVYSELAHGVPTIFSHLMSNLPAMHSVLVFVCVKFLPLPNVPDEERFLFRRVGPKQYQMYRCAVRFGYMDLREDDDKFEDFLLQALINFVRTESAEIEPNGGTVRESTNSPADESAKNTTSAVEPMDLVAAAKRLLKRSESQESVDGIHSIRMVGAPQAYSNSLEGELAVLAAARQAGIVYLLGHTDIKASNNSSEFKKFVIDHAYNALQRNSRSSTVYLNIPHSKLLQVGMIHKI